MITHNSRFSLKWLLIFSVTFITSIYLYEIIHIKPTSITNFLVKLVSDTSVAGIAITLAGGSTLGVVSWLRSKRASREPDDPMVWELTEQLASARGWDELAGAIFTTIAQWMPVEMGSLAVFDPAQGRYRRVAEWRPDWQSEEGSGTPAYGYCYPLVAGHPVAGHLVADHPVGRNPVARLYLFTYGITTLKPTQLKQLARLAPEMVSAIQKMAGSIYFTDDANAQEKTEKLLRDERRRIAKELHDTLGQDIAYLRLKLDQMANSPIPENTDAFQKDLSRMLGVANEAYTKVRREIASIEPVASGDLNRSLKDMLQKMEVRNPIEVTYHSNHPALPFSPDVQRQVIGIVREALNNIEKHAQAEKVTLNLDWREDRLAVTICDNGRGFQPDAARGSRHYGLAIMRERAESIQGQLALTSAPGQGTEISLVVPLSQAVSLAPFQINTINP